MKIPTQWNAEPELFEAIAEALECADLNRDEGDDDEGDIGVTSSEERGEYGEHGYIRIHWKNGRRFQIELHEIV